MENKEIVLSGIRATGNLHLGNYYGALNKFVKMQDDYDCLYFIADLHALTTNPDPKALHENVHNILAQPPSRTRHANSSASATTHRISRNRLSGLTPTSVSTPGSSPIPHSWLLTSSYRKPIKYL